MIITEPSLAAYRADPAFELIGYPGRAVFPNCKLAAWVATIDYTTRHADLARRFLAGMNKGAQWVNSILNTPAYAQPVAGYTKLEPDRVAAASKGPSSIDLTASDVRRVADAMRKNGILDASFDPGSKIFSPKIVGMSTRESAEFLERHRTRQNSIARSQG